MNAKTDKNFNKRRKRLFLRGNAGSDCWGYSNSLSNLRTAPDSDPKYTQKFSRKHQRNIGFRFIKDVAGAVNSAEFLIYVTIIVFLLFGGVDYYVTQTQHDSLEHIKDYYTDRMRIEGNLTEEARTELYNLLSDRGYKNIHINVLNDAGNEIDSADIITRNADNPTYSVMELQIRVTPKFVPFMLGRMIGVKEDENFYFMVKGKVLSEKPM